MKKTTLARQAVAPVQLSRRTSRDAESELIHLESVLRYLSGGNLDAQPLASDYWRARIGELESRYWLLAAQTVRVAALKSLANALRPAPAAAAPNLGARKIAA